MKCWICGQETVIDELVFINGMNRLVFKCPNASCNALNGFLDLHYDFSNDDFNNITKRGYSKIRHVPIKDVHGWRSCTSGNIKTWAIIMEDIHGNQESINGEEFIKIISLGMEK